MVKANTQITGVVFFVIKVCYCPYFVNLIVLKIIKAHIVSRGVVE